jgi:hypothetical protein
VRRKMPKMKYYIRYGNWKPEYMGNPDALKKTMEKWSKKVEEFGLKVIFWGSPLGVSENSVVVYKGSPENFVKIPFGETPYTDSRTNVVMKF